MLSMLIVAQASGPKGQLFCNTDSFIRIIDNIRAMTSCLSIGKTTQPQKATGAQIRNKTYYHTYIFKITNNEKDLFRAKDK